jgi:hypothetical protein
LDSSCFLILFTLSIPVTMILVWCNIGVPLHDTSNKFFAVGRAYSLQSVVIYATYTWIRVTFSYFIYICSMSVQFLMALKWCWYFPFCPLYDIVLDISKAYLQPPGMLCFHSLFYSFWCMKLKISIFSWLWMVNGESVKYTIHSCQLSLKNMINQINTATFGNHFTQSLIIDRKSVV